MTQAGSVPDPRIVEILGQIKVVFAQKGFDGASMQDLARAAGMSAGNFYRYFPSKNAIIEAMVELDQAEVGEKFRAILASDDPRGQFLATLRAEFAAHGADCDGHLWAEIEAAARRRPEVAEIKARMEARVRQYLTRTFAAIGRIDPAEAARRFDTHAGLLIILFKGVCMRVPQDPQLVDLSMTVIEGMLDEVAAAGPVRSPVTAEA